MKLPLSILLLLFVLPCNLNLISAASSSINDSRKRSRADYSANSASNASSGDEEQQSDDAETSEACRTDVSSSSRISVRIESPRPSGSPRVRRRVTFSPEIITETDYEINGQSAELKYFNALFSGKFILADSMRRHGLILSPSPLTFQGVKKILRGPDSIKCILDELIKFQPHVFGQFYAVNSNVFKDAQPIHIQHVLNALKSDQNVLLNVYKEHLRNPLIDFPEELYCTVRPNRAIEMIELAEAAGNQEEIRKCYLLPGSLLHYDLDGDTLFTKAVKSKNIDRINWLFKRSDAVKLMYTANYDEYNSFDLAMELFDEDLDPDYSVFRCLLQVITIAYRTNKVDDFEQIVENILDHCREADSREILLEALEEEFEAAKAYARENAVGDIQDEFISNIEERLLQLQSGTF